MLGQEFTPPQNTNLRDKSTKTVFLAGTIDMGKSEHWQQGFSETLRLNNLTVFNPRRSDWDTSWVQSIENPQFYQQVNWELEHMDKADYILMNFIGGSLSPITLLELGLYANSKKLHVICDEDFWRKGNVDIVCSKYNIPMHKTITHFLFAINTTNK